MKPETVYLNAAKWSTVNGKKKKKKNVLMRVYKHLCVREGGVGEREERG